VGRAALGEAWRRRIGRVTGLEIAWASGNGGYMFAFTTVDHVHGWFDLKAYRGVGSGDVWGLYEIGYCPGYSSCRDLFSG
jgi:hypothetical protein